MDGAIALAMGAAFAVLPCLAGQDAENKVARRPLRMGETAIDVVISERAGSKHLFCNLHDDENTAVQAGLVALRRSGGRLVELQHGGQRDIAFRLDGGDFAVDPNRIFTTEGVRRTLARDCLAGRRRQSAPSSSSPGTSCPSTPSSGRMS